MWSSLVWTWVHSASNPLRVGISTERTRRPFRLVPALVTLIKVFWKCLLCQPFSKWYNCWGKQNFWVAIRRPLAVQGQSNFQVRPQMHNCTTICLQCNCNLPIHLSLSECCCTNFSETFCTFGNPHISQGRRCLAPDTIQGNLSPDQMQK